MMTAAIVRLHELPRTKQTDDVDLRPVIVILDIVVVNYRWLFWLWLWLWLFCFEFVLD
jgi:hypothetical protein